MNTDMISAYLASVQPDQNHADRSLLAEAGESQVDIANGDGDGTQRGSKYRGTVQCTIPVPVDLELLYDDIIQCAIQVAYRKKRTQDPHQDQDPEEDPEEDSKEDPEEDPREDPEEDSREDSKEDLYQDPLEDCCD